MPAYYKDGKGPLLLQGGLEIQDPVAQFGFEDAAQLDDGTLWPTVHAITDIHRGRRSRHQRAGEKAVG